MPIKRIQDGEYKRTPAQKLCDEFIAHGMPKINLDEALGFFDRIDAILKDFAAKTGIEHAVLQYEIAAAVCKAARNRT